MSAGRRPKIVPLDAATPGPVVPGVMELVSRDRGQFPTHVLMDLPWLAAPTSGTEVLVVLDPGGIARLLPWKPHGEKVAARRKELIAKLQADAAIEEALVKLEARYKHAVIGTDLRMTIPPELSAHLDIDDTPPARGYCFRIGERLELLSRGAT